MIRVDSLTKRWPIFPLGECAYFLDHLRKPVKSNLRKEGPYPYYGANGQQGTIDNYLFDEDLVLLAEDGGFFGQEGKTIAYRISGKTWVNNHAHVLRPKKGFDVDFLCRVLECYDVIPFITGTTRAKLNKSDALRIPIPRPSLDEQRRIAAILDKADAIRRKRQETLKLADGLVKSRFIEMFGDPVMNPMGWEMPHIEAMVAEGKNALKAGPFGSSLKKEYYVESGYKIYGQEQVIRADAHYGDYYINETKYHELQSCAVQANDVLISLVGTYGKLLIIPDDYEPGIINPRLMKITFNPQKINTTYFRFFFEADSVIQKLSENTHGGTMEILNLGIVRKIRIPLPPLALQNQFAAFVKQADKSKFAMQRQLAEAVASKAALMQQFFS